MDWGTGRMCWNPRGMVVENQEKKKSKQNSLYRVIGFQILRMTF